MPRAHHRQHGLSLLEVLVTVTLFAMLFAVLTQGWYQAAQAQSALSTASAQLRQRQHLILTLRRVVDESLASGGRGVAPFVGDARSLATESSHVPGAGTGAAPTPVRLVFSGRPLRLTIEAEGRPALSFEAVFDEATIDYIDAAGRSHEQWPPVLASTAAAAEKRPSLLRFTLRLQGQSQPFVVLAAPRASGWDLPEDLPPLFGVQQ